MSVSFFVTCSFVIQSAPGMSASGRVVAPPYSPSATPARNASGCGIEMMLYPEST